MKAKERIESKLDAVNGARRERIVRYAEAVQAIREALHDGYGYACGGRVANSYRYPAVQTRVAAWAYSQVVRVHIEEASATTSGTGLPFRRGTCDAKAREVIAADLSTPARRGELRISRREARAIVAAQDRIDADRAISRVPAELLSSRAPVTVAHSLAAANCERETRRVAAWFSGRESVPAGELLQAVAARAPGLVSFAVRAAAFAASAK